VHQGSKLIPADFLPASSHNPLSPGHASHHCILLSNFFAQPGALAFGKTEQEFRVELGAFAGGLLVKCKAFEGNRLSNSIIFACISSTVISIGQKLDEDLLCRDWRRNLGDKFTPHKMGTC
jgi:glucose-6-phosphate isomerase